ncbi:hypothetical protein V6K52_05680 [Knoellia sp. S7-12]|uniref:hypothetical protein n=1 Tax=Knoellia sp. S7-12 TaxID=3126698 RepID=UPI00336843C0
MNGTQVPLWALLLTGLAAVVGPMVSTWSGNRNAVALLREQHSLEQRAAEQARQEERRVAELAVKRAVYSEALTVYSQLRSIDTTLSGVNFDGSHVVIDSLTKRLHEVSTKVAICAGELITLSCEGLLYNGEALMARTLISAHGEANDELDAKLRVRINEYRRDFDKLRELMLRDLAEEHARRDGQPFSMPHDHAAAPPPEKEERGRGGS